MIVDAHVHLLPGRIGEKVRDFMESVIGALLVYPNDHGVVRERLAAAGVDELWSLPYAHKPGIAAGLNASMAEIAAQPGPVVVRNGCTAHPGDAAPADDVRRAVEDLGSRMLKLHCSVGDYGPDDPRLDPVWTYVSAVRLPVVVHAGHSVTGHTESGEVAPIGTVAERFPEARIVIAHCGCHAIEAALDLVEAHPNVYADLTPVVTDAVAIPSGRLSAVAHKLLFGSDAPNVGITVEYGIARVRAMPLPDDQIAAILGGTAARLVAGVGS